MCSRKGLPSAQGNAGLLAQGSQQQQEPGGTGNNNNNSNKKGKGKKNKGKKKSAAEKALELKEGGGVSKPKRGACHRCGGPHFVRHCPKPLVTDDAS